MGDYSTAQIIFYDVPAVRVPAVLAWLADWHLREDYAGEPPTETVKTWTVYGDHDAGLGIMLDGAMALEAAAPGSTWKLTQDAKYEWDAEHHTHVPGLGRWHGRCTQDGEPLFTRDQIMTTAGSNWDLDYLTGGPWLRAINALAVAKNPG